MATQLSLIADNITAGTLLQDAYPSDIAKHSLGDYDMKSVLNTHASNAHVFANNTSATSGTAIYLGSKVINADYTIDFVLHVYNYTSGHMYIGCRAPGGSSKAFLAVGHSYGVGWACRTYKSDGTFTSVTTAGSTTLANGTYTGQIVVSGNSVTLTVGGLQVFTTTQSTLTDAGYFMHRNYQSTVSSNNLNYGLALASCTVTANDINVSEPAMRWAGSAGTGGARSAGSAPTNSTGN